MILEGEEKKADQLGTLGPEQQHGAGFPAFLPAS